MNSHYASTGVYKVNQDCVCDFRTNSCSRFSLVIPLFSLTHGYWGSLIITKPQAKPSSFFTAQEETCKSLPQKKLPPRPKTCLYLYRGPTKNNKRKTIIGHVGCRCLQLFLNFFTSHRLLDEIHNKLNLSANTPKKFIVISEGQRNLKICKNLHKVCYIFWY